MRAHFIRGEDPKVSMDIGNKILRIKDRMEMAARILCRDYDLDTSTVTSKMDERGISVEFEGKKPNILYPYNYWIWYDIERKHYWAGYSNANGDIEDQEPVDDLEKAMLKTRVALSRFNWHAKGAVKEAFNFERGRDPKSSMRIGYYYAKSQEFMDFIKKELYWNDPNIEMTEDGNFTYDCLPGNSVIRELREAVEKFGWADVIKVNKDPDDWASRHHDDGATRHYYVLKFKKDKKLKESVNFERGIEPMDAMKIGDVAGRKIKQAREKIYLAIKEMAINYWGAEVWELKDNPYMRIKEKKTKEFIEVGIEYTPEGTKGSSYYAYIVYVPEPDEDLTEWAAGYKVERKFKIPPSPNTSLSESDEFPYDTFDEAINKMEYWLKNF